MSDEATVPVTSELEIDTSGPIRRFTNQRIQAAVDQALLSIPENHLFAGVAVATLEGAKLAVMVRLGDQFSAMGVLERSWGGVLKAEAAVIYSPF
jgi:hypothetical protein